MDIRFEEVSATNLNAILGLKVHESQQKFVADNARSIAQGTYDENAWFRGIYAGDEPVGFVMLSIDESAAEYYVWRLMIDAEQQGKGYGKAAMLAVIDLVRVMPNAKALRLSYVPDEGSAGPFYERLGFVETGEVDEGERVMRLEF